MISFIKRKITEWGVISPHNNKPHIDTMCDTLDDSFIDDILLVDLDELEELDELFCDEDLLDDDWLNDEFEDLLDEDLTIGIFSDLEDDLMGADQTIDNLESLVEMGGDEPAPQPTKFDLITQLSGNQAFKIEYMDITTVTNGFIAHGVNCQLAMGSGVARALFMKWPLVRQQYMLRGQGKGMLGTADRVRVEPEVSVFNCYTQEFCGPGDRRYANSASIMVSLQQVALSAVNNRKPMYVPLVGCDLGGLDYQNDFLPVLEQLMILYPDLDLTLCVYP